VADRASPVATRGLAHSAPLIVASPVVLGVAWVLWAVSDRLLWIGPLDRAAFGWLVVLPLLVLTTPVAADTWDGLDRRGRIAAGLALGASVAAVLSALLAGDRLAVECQSGPALVGPVEVIARSLVAGTVAGAQVAAVLITQQVRPRMSFQRWAAGALAGAAAWTAALAITMVMTPFAMCPRP
jgi:hypothetical protein